MGPPVPVRRWSAGTIKAAIADESVRSSPRCHPTAPTTSVRMFRQQLATNGWGVASATDDGFAAGQPQFVFRSRWTGRTLRGRARRHEPAVAAQHQEGGQAGGRDQTGTATDLPAFHTLYVETASATGSHPARCRTSSDVGALQREDPDRIRLYLAHHEGQPGRGNHLGPRRYAHLVLLRSVVDREARRPGLERDPVADDHSTRSPPAPTSTTCAGSPTRWPPTTRTSV